MLAISGVVDIVVADTARSGSLSEGGHPSVFQARRRPLPQAGPKLRQGQIPGPVGNIQSRVFHELVANPICATRISARTTHQRQAALRRKIAYHVREIEALGLEVTLARIP
jgi:hypothetical protein